MIPEYIKLSSGAVEAVFAENRYRGTRFDRAGEIVSLKFRGFEYFGKWTDCPDPSFHDCISGVPEEFAQIGYDAAPVGGVFLKIGVGALVKPDSAPYNFRRTYPVSDAGGRRAAFSEDSAEFVHGMDTNIGYAYEYTKKIRLETDGISVSHRLENTGERTIETSVYDHNFFTFGGAAAGGGTSVDVPFGWNGERLADFDALVEISGGRISFKRAVAAGEFALLKGVKTPPGAASYDIAVSCAAGGAARNVRIKCDRPNARMNFWACSSCVCPEPFVDINVAPGGAFEWNIDYSFS